MADARPWGYLSDKQAEVAMTDHEPTSIIPNDDDVLALESQPTPADPRRTTTRVVRRGRPLPGQSTFLAWPAASSLIFLLSAACLLGGAWTVFTSLGIDPEQLRERLALIGTVHLYELALVAVAVVLCRFQRANPDAIGPVILGACFLVGSAVTLDLVSIDAPYVTLAFGAIGLLLMCAKGLVLARLGGGASHMLLLLPLALLMSWNLLWPGVMGLYLHHTVSGLASTAWWMPGWIVVLAATALLVIGIVRDDGVGIERLRPFLRRSTLRWVLGLAIAGCSAIHLQVLGYLHSLDVTLGEALPMLALLCLGAVDLRHRAAGRAKELDRVLLALPCGLALAAILAEEHGVMSNPQASGVVFAPALVLLAYAALVWRLGHHRGQTEWRWVAAAAGALGVLLWGATSSPSSFNWSLTGVAITAGMALRAVQRRQPIALVKALVIATAIGLLQPSAISWQVAHSMLPLATLVTAIGVVVLVVALTWGAERRAAVVRLALWLVTIGVVLSCAKHGALSLVALAGGGVLVAVHVIAWWRTRDAWTLLSLSVPAVLVALAPENKGWLAVWAAFILLAAGVWMSWLRIRAQATRPRRDLPRSTTNAPRSVPQGVLE